MLRFDDETLMAYADGELDDETRQAIEKAIDSDESLAARVAMFKETAILSKRALDPLLDTPVPESLRAGIVELMARDDSPATAETVVPFTPPAPQSSRRPFAAWVTAMAASVTLVVGGLGGYLVGQQTGGMEEPGVLSAARFDQPGLSDALRTVESGREVTLEATDDRLRLIASYRDADDDLCREFEIDQPDRSTFVSVACHKQGAWSVQFTVAAAGQEGSGYAPASSLETLEAYLQAVGAGEVLSEEAESQALERLRAR